MNYYLQYLQDLMQNVWVKFILIYLAYLLVIFLIYLYYQKYLQTQIENLKKKIDFKNLKNIFKYLKVFIVLLGFNFATHFSNLEELGINIYKYIFRCLEVSVVIFMSLQLISIIKTFYYNFFKTYNSQYIGLVNLVSLLAKIIVIVVGILVILDILNINITPFLASAGLVGLAVAMGSKEIVQNFLSGIILLIDKPFDISHKIKLDNGSDLQVEEIGIRTTKFKTNEGNILIIPNGNLLNMKIENLSAEEIISKKISFEINLPYGIDIILAKNLLFNILEQEHRFNKETLRVGLSTFTDKLLIYKISGELNVENYSNKIIGELIEKIYLKINEANIGFIPGKEN